MMKAALLALAAATLTACGTVIDFGPEPGSAGDESYWHYQPELHGPNAPPRGDAKAAEDARPAPAAGATDTRSEPATSAQPGTAGAYTETAPGAGAQPQPVLPPPPPPSAVTPAPTSETMFNDAIRRAVEAGDIDRALRLLEEAERLGSRSARPTFIDAVGSR